MEEQFGNYHIQMRSQQPAQHQSEDVHMSSAETLEQKENRPEQPCDPSQPGGCGPSPFAKVMAAFDDAAELDTILSGIEGFQPAPVHGPHGSLPHRAHGPHAEGPLSRAASASRQGSTSRQGSAYPGMERTEVCPDFIPGSQPSPRFTAALLKALSTPKAMSAVRALSALYPGLERPEVVQQLQKQMVQHGTAAPLSRKQSEWLSYPGMERGLSLSSQQGRAQPSQKQAVAAQRLGSLGSRGSDWLSCPGLEHAFSGPAKQQPQGLKRILSGAESIRSRPEPCQSLPGQCPPSAFACMAAEPLSRNPSGQFSYPGMERGFSTASQQHQAVQQPKQSMLQGRQQRAASLLRNSSDWLSYPGLEGGPSVKPGLQGKQQSPLHGQQHRAASMQRVPSDWLSYPGMERGLSVRPKQGKQQAPLQELAQRAASMQRLPSDWLSYPGMERGLSLQPRQASQLKSDPPLIRKASQRLAAQAQLRPALCLDTAYSARSNMSDCEWPGMEQCFECASPSSGPRQAFQRKSSIPLSHRSSQRLSSRAHAPHTQLHLALCLETSYSVCSNLSDCEWPGMEQGFDCASPPSRLHQALCLECAPSLSSHSGLSDCDWPGLEAGFDCSSSSPPSRLREALCLETAASVHSNVSDGYFPGLERLLSLRAAAPALQRLASIGGSSLMHCMSSECPCVGSSLRAPCTTCVQSLSL